MVRDIEKAGRKFINWLIETTDRVKDLEERVKHLEERVYKESE